MENFEIGSVFRRSLRTCQRNLASFVLLGLLAHCPAIVYSANGSVELSDPGEAIRLLSLVLSMMLLGAVSYGSVLELKGNRVSFFKCLQVAATHMLAITSVGLMLGFFPFLIAYKPSLLSPLLLPWILITTVLYVAIPALVAEQSGVLASLRRSAELSYGRRWKIFAILLLLGVAKILGIEIVDRAVPADEDELIIVTQLGLDMLIEVFAAVVAAVTYFELARTGPLYSRHG